MKGRARDVLISNMSSCSQKQDAPRKKKTDLTAPLFLSRPFTQEFSPDSLEDEDKPSPDSIYARRER